MCRDALKLCVGCKACRRECPTGVDMARMKTEVLYQRAKTRPPKLHDRLVAYLPRAAPLGPLLNLRDQVPGLAGLSERWLGFSAKRRLPKWRRPYRPMTRPGSGARQVVLLPDTFNRHFEPENLAAAERVLVAAGYDVIVPQASGRPLCCGRTFLSAGLVEQARAEARRTCEALRSYVERDLWVVGLEPSCLLTLRDEFKILLGKEAIALAERALLFEEFLGRADATLDLKPLGRRRALLHGHCHQKAFGVMASVTEALARIPELKTETIETSCCGMAGAFGYRAETSEISRQMAELDLLPALRAASDDALVVADGFSCRHQIADLAGRQALHCARVLEQALA